jgi:predicted AAA+ superfamily ATPase
MDDSRRDYLPRMVDSLLDELPEQLPGLMIIGPRAVGKTTTLARRANSIVRLDSSAEAVAFEADPDAALRTYGEPVLLDEWQLIPQVLAAVKRSIDERPGANRFYLSGSVNADWGSSVYPGTGRVQRVRLLPLSVRELEQRAGGETFLDRLARGEEILPPNLTPDLRGYIDLALRGGFPSAAVELTGSGRTNWLASYIDSLLVHDVELAAESGSGRRADPGRVRRYFESCALNTAGVVDHRQIHEVASVSKQTGEAYDNLLNRLMVIDRVPAWSSSRFSRLVKRPKRYVVDTSLVGAALNLDADDVLSDGNVLGRIIDTFVMAQLRPEIPVSTSRPRLFHLRTKGGRQEIDLVVELGGGRLIGIEIKAGAAPTRSDAKHLAWLRDQTGSRFVSGVVLHTGPRTFRLEDRIIAAPIASIWG